MKKIFITPRSFPRDDAKIKELLQENNFDVLYNDKGRTYLEEEMAGVICDIEGLLVGLDPVTEKVLENAPRLKGISKYGAGLDNIDLSAAKARGIKVTNTVGANATSVAEAAVGLCFILARNIYPAVFGVKAGKWDRSRGIEIKGKTMGIAGFGSIGQEVHGISQGMGMNVLVSDPYISNIEVVPFNELLERSDFLSLHVPLNSETEHIIRNETLLKMKRSAYLINTARGGLINEDDLYDALTSGVIAGAASDVFSKEPPGENKLLQLDNFILTPHIGAFTEEATLKMAQESLENLIATL